MSRRDARQCRSARRTRRAAVKKLKWITHLPRKSRFSRRRPPSRRTDARPCISSMTYTMVIRPVRPPGWPLIITPRVKRRHVVEVVPRPREWQCGQVSLFLSLLGEAYRWTRNSTCLLRSCRTARCVASSRACPNDRRNPSFLAARSCIVSRG